MKHLYQILASSKLALLLLLAFAIAMGVATFLENDFGVTFSWGYVYNSWWFEGLMILLTVSFVLNIFKYKLYHKSKWAILLFHIAFVIIMLGAGITRYTSYTGIMRIREHAQSNIIITQDEYLKVAVKKGTHQKQHQFKISNFEIQTSHYEKEIPVENNSLVIRKKQFVVDAVPFLKTVYNGDAILSLIVSTQAEKENIYLREGTTQTFHQQDNVISFNKYVPNAINIVWKNQQLKISYPKTFDFYQMTTQKAGVLQGGVQHPFQLKTLYRVGDLSIVANDFNPSGVVRVQTGNVLRKNDVNIADAVVFEMNYLGEKMELPLFFKEGYVSKEQLVSLNDVVVNCSYGPQEVQLPFALHLNNFVLERYPGSSSPSAYTSYLTVQEGDLKKAYKIFMNNVLDYKGYRFFQASYDTDEKGTVLSVNYDRFGTLVTYVGYFLMTIGMFFTLFGAKTRFRRVLKKLNNLPKSYLLLVLLMVTQVNFAKSKTFIVADEVLKCLEIEQKEADQFGAVLVQDVGGRIKPMNTMALELVRKITGKTKYIIPLANQTIQLNANQLFLSLQIYPEKWQMFPLIKVEYEKINRLLPSLKVYQNKQVSYANLLLPNGVYKLSGLVEAINKKKPSDRSEAENEVLKLDERFNVLFNLFSGEYLKIFPNKLDRNHTWYTPKHHFNNFSEEDGTFAKGVVTEYFYQLSRKNWREATQLLTYIKTYQQVVAKEIIPTVNQVKFELYYNKINLNFWMFQFLLMAGTVLLCLSMIKIFCPRQWISKLMGGLKIAVLVSGVLLAINLGVRWYVSEHAPWSNGYEMLIFVAWLLLLFGLIFHKKTDFALPLATLFTGVLLLVSYLDWINPEITNLMPVLKSYWLKIHVAVIVSSYAPLALSALLSSMALVLMNFNHHPVIRLKIKEMTYLVEIAITLGLFLLSVGTFLGGVWANESWGRYWAWDPKETWALISMMIYAVVLHLRLIPALKSKYVLHFASMWAFWSIIMTSFGVNYYLKGLHSYASGDPIPVPVFVYVMLLVMGLVSLLPKLIVRKNMNKK